MAAHRLRVNEIFFSIQGESTWAGCPCVFVRLTGCHLRCTYCDTEYAFKEGQSRSIDDIVTEVCAYPCNLIEITGGEPLLQKAVHPLISKLCDLGKTVLIETSGACDISLCDPRAIRIMDIKTPGSGESARTLWSNIDHLTSKDEVKFVIADRADYEWAVKVIRTYELAQRVRCEGGGCGGVLFSPVFEQPGGLEIFGATGLSPRTLAEWMLADGLQGVRMQMQLHKMIWEPQTRGV